MSLNGILQAGTSGLLASQTVLRSISNNVANVNTPGYARERVQLASLAFQGGQGGVTVAGIETVEDRYLAQSARAAVGDSSYKATLSDYQGRLQTLLGKPGDSGTLSAQTDALFTSLQNLSANPSDSIRRSDVINQLKSVLDNAGALAQDVQTLRTNASNELETTLSSVNDLLGRLDTLNNQIVAQKVLGGQTSALVSQRNAAMEELSGLVDVVAREQPDGSMQISTGSGMVLLDKSVRRSLYTGPGLVTPDSDFSPISIHNVDKVTGLETDTKTILEGNVLGGKVRALLDLRDVELPATADGIGRFVQTLADEANRIHNQFSSVPAPAQLAGRNTGLEGSDPARFSGKINIGIADSNGNIARSITVDLSTKATINDIVSDINSQLAGTGSASFPNGKLSIGASGGGGVMVQDDAGFPTDRGGRSFGQVFGLNDLITGPQATSFATGVAASDAHGFNGGSFTLNLRNSNNVLLAGKTITLTAGGSFQSVLNDLNDPASLGRFATFSLNGKGELEVTPKNAARFSLTIPSDSTSRGTSGTSLSSFFGLSRSTTANAALQMKVRPDIAADPGKLASARFDPTAAIGSKALGTGDARGINALRDLSQGNLTFKAAGNLAARSATLSGYAGAIISEASQRASDADQQAKDSKALADAQVSRRDNFQGVNLDEELSQLTIYQNSYNASARLITTAQQLYDELLNIFR